MKKLLALSLLSLVAACSAVAPINESELIDEFQPKGNELLLVVSAKTARFTWQYPGKEECDKDQHCISRKYWHIYSARVLDVVYGQYSVKDISFLLLQHTNYIKEYTNEWYILIKPIEDKDLIDELGVNFYVVEERSGSFP